jgi:hypothetical protein
VFSEIFYIAEQRDAAFNNMSEAQKAEIRKRLEDNKKEFEESGSFLRIHKDKAL